MRTQHDCIEGAGRKLQEAGVDEAELKRIDGEVRQVITQAAEFAQASPEPDPSELWTDVLLEG